MPSAHLLVVLTAGLVLACSKSSAPPGADGAPPPPVAEGAPAPPVTFTLTDGSRVPLASLRGSRVLIYFYPEDDTPGCTAQAEGIRDHYADLEAAGLKVFGVSTQDAESHRAFIDKYSLPFPLVVDSDHTIAEAFEVTIVLGRAMRDSFLIGTDGRIEKIWRAASTGSHAADVLAWLHERDQR